MSDDLTLLAYLAQHLALTALPMAAGALLAARLGLRSVPLLLAVGLAAGGAVATLGFWAFYADPLVGETWAYLVLFGSVALVGWLLREGSLDAKLLRGLATPLLLWALGSAFVVWLGFLHGGVESPLATASIRFSGQLPTDNDIPRFYADWFFQNGHAGEPPVFPGEWLSSDRPPLQVGYVLSQRPFGWDDEGLHYQVLGVVLQQLWIVGLWALLLAAGVGGLTRALAMVTVLVSDLAILNAFFVWPKLLPAAMLLAAAAIVLTPLWGEARRSLPAAALLAALLGLAMLGHGASAFGVVSLAAIAAVRGLPGWRWIGLGVLVGAIFLAPWSAYQKYGDPPGNRLVKWQIGGVIDVDERGSLETIVDSYREAGVGGTLENKADNFSTMVGGEDLADNVDAALAAADAGDSAGVVRTIRNIFFFYLLPSLGLLLLAPLAMTAAWRGPRASPLEWSFALTCFAAFGLGAVAWGLLMFGGETAQAVVHQGSYLLPILGFCGAVVGLRASFPRFAVGLVLLNAALMLALYVPALDPPEASSYSPVAGLLAAGALAAFAAVAVGPRTTLARR